MFSRLATRTPVFSQTVRRFSQQSKNFNKNLKKNVDNVTQKMDAEVENVEEILKKSFEKFMKMQRDANKLTVGSVLLTGGLFGAVIGSGYGAYSGFKIYYESLDNRYGSSFEGLVFGPLCGCITGGIIGLTFPISVPAALVAKISYDAEKIEKAEKKSVY